MVVKGLVGVLRVNKLSLPVPLRALALNSSDIRSGFGGHIYRLGILA